MYRIFFSVQGKRVDYCKAFELFVKATTWEMHSQSCGSRAESYRCQQQDDGVQARGFLDLTVYHKESKKKKKKQNPSVYTDNGKCTCIIWTVPLPTVNMKVSLTSNAALFLSVYVSDLSKTNLKSSKSYTVFSL